MRGRGSRCLGFALMAIFPPEVGAPVSQDNWTLSAHHQSATDEEEDRQDPSPGGSDVRNWRLGGPERGAS